MIHAQYDRSIITSDGMSHDMDIVAYLEDLAPSGDKEIMLVDESLFVCDTRTIQQPFHTPISVHMLQDIVTEREMRLSYTGPSERLHISYDMVSVDGVPSRSLLGKSGYITARFHALYPTPTLEHMMHKISYRYKKNNIYHRLIWLPRGHYTREFIHHHLQRQSYAVMTIDDAAITLYATHNGHREHVHTLNYGTAILQDMMKVHGSPTMFGEMMANELSGSQERLCTHIASEYLSIVTDWMRSLEMQPTTLFIISSLLQSSHMTQVLCDTCTQQTQRFVIPFGVSATLSAYDRGADPLYKDMSAAIYYTDS